MNRDTFVTLLNFAGVDPVAVLQTIAENNPSVFSQALYQTRSPNVEADAFSDTQHDPVDLEHWADSSYLKFQANKIYENEGKVAAVKYIRSKKGCGLKEAIDWFDNNVCWEKLQ